MKKTLILLFAVFGSVSMAIASHAKQALVVPDTGWRIWLDTQAKWQDDALFLPSEVDLAKLPVNPPTGGWAALGDTVGKEVTLPSTVEQHYWGGQGLRAYNSKEYLYSAVDHAPQSGIYEGVSWWWKDIDVPSSFSAEMVELKIRGMRQRAEIYVNSTLVGYDIIAETAYSCNVGKALRPGKKNRIAIRITNPGGRVDWRDWTPLNWGQYEFQAGHGFGGLDRGITLEVHDPVYISDAWVLNTLKPREVTAFAEIRNTTAEAQEGTVTWSIKGKSQQQSLSVSVPAHQTVCISKAITDEQAKLWELDSPQLYTMTTEWKGAGKARPTKDVKEILFGFRSIEVRGIGTNAGLFLNDRRVRLYTAISWGFWGLNGLWPTPELAEKEVKAAKALNLNCLNFHRDIGKEEVFSAQDRLGLLRYMEPGGGRCVLDKDGERNPTKMPLNISGEVPSSSFGQKYMEEKIMRMVRMFRSHPSLIVYNLQNEHEPDFRSPRLYNILKAMHTADPSRVIVAKSGISPNNQAWFAPYEDKVRFDDGTGYSGWFDRHTVGGPGVWTDDLFKNPKDFTHKTDGHREIVDWGEMLGFATPDNHALMLDQIKASGGSSYDLKDHQVIDAAYNAFLDKWGFRTAFPTTQQLYYQIGDKAYEAWGRVLEAARMSEGNDILTVSGWESTAVENHSGIVDNQRNIKGKAELLSTKIARLLPVAKPRGVTHSVGSVVLVDLFLFNETGKAAAGTLNLTLTDPNGKTMDAGTFTAPVYIQDQFAYPIKEAVALPPLSIPGEYTINVTLEGGGSAQKNSERILAIAPPAPRSSDLSVGIVGNMQDAKQALGGIPNLSLKPYAAKGAYDLVVLFGKIKGFLVQTNDGSKVGNTDDDILFYTSLRGSPNNLKLEFGDIPKGAAKVTLYFNEPTATGPSQRVFSIEINGKEVLKDFDIFAEAHGKSKAISKTFEVDAPEGRIVIRPSSEQPSKAHLSAGTTALINAVKIEANGKVIACSCGGDGDYTDKDGLVWKPYEFNDLWPTGLTEIIKAGTPLLVMVKDEPAAKSIAKKLAEAGALKFTGLVGPARASWMGSWVFVRQHPVYDGIIGNGVMKGFEQQTVKNLAGLLVDGPGVQVIAAYSRDHDSQIGATTFTVPLGKGTVLFQALSGLQPLVQERFLDNSISFLTQKKQ